MANYRVIPATEPADALAEEYQGLLDASLEAIRAELVQPLLDGLALDDGRSARPVRTLPVGLVAAPEMNSGLQPSPSAWDKAVRTSCADEILAMDSPRHRDMIRSFIARFADWTRQYETKAEGLASWFGSSTEGHASNVLKHNLARALGKPVHLRMSSALERQLGAVVSENVTLIRSIHGVYAEQVTTMVMESVTSGRDIASLAQGLEERFGVARSRARLIAVDQNNKATAFIDRQRRLDLGIRQGRWRHMWSQHPRADHQAASGTVYDLAQGCLISGKFIHPGEEINCNCLSESVIPGLADWTPGSDLTLRTQ